MSIVKKLLFTLVFVLAALILPGIIMLVTLDAVKHFSVILSVYAIIVFAVLGYILVSNISLSKELKEAVEEMKKQNSAIAYKLTGGADELLNQLAEKKKEDKEKKHSENDADKTEKENVDTSKINLNPETPLELTGKKEEIKKTKVVADDFNDFK